ncbi:MAG: tRNA (adenosine(37)-N6)-threonylcarbamoyltransferase complex dimerization subunit type 1 TsaB [Bacilli bacterium]|jgi:tRNA threonylcarbamoyl adenosine modification protein YeaZ|nr:tRNA (adenosine(37)-N6)-threonylcarbamoyltransferase complex dimerization subunit type 1 TsaB [Bacilli bacterium]MCH4210552.1 tRNA (adenosine(37)-N6)-threonylcarbamoyltransferase complex dimerization subunit type 1 TsaB [Bacilli bacterium]MCH4228805.1 tRNA (adenosine(37)-N6)-threonylcarbamoyltransferase complex dimerization subunit type 1 TsaB [Bacilli bacterium]MCH4277398.1 tRNA (adenosine(37)-N6)-threonylcarbamoyltransferase complex dimerization subunit type 1 TsaB [Bacilli bacterium]
MYSVLIDSSNTDLAVAISSDHTIIAKTQYEAWQKQSEYLVYELDKLLKGKKLTRKDISYIVVSKGPGSYTGVRIALSVAKVMAFSISCPLYLVSSLEVEKDESKPSICLMNARSKRSYIGVYDGEKILMEDTIKTNEEVLSYIKEHPSYAVRGDVSYLELKNEGMDVLSNLNHADIERNLCKEPLAAKPVYLKDNYPV